MSVLNTNPEQLRSVSMRGRDLSYLIRQLAAVTRNIRMSMDYEIRAKEEIARKLSRLEEQISGKADTLRAYSDTLEQISALYLRTEKENVARLYADSADTQGTHSIIGKILPVEIKPWIIVPPSPRPAPFIPRPLPWPYPVIPTPRPVPPHIPPKPSILDGIDSIKIDWEKLREKLEPLPPKPAPKPSLVDVIDWSKISKTKPVVYTSTVEKLDGWGAWKPTMLDSLNIRSALSALGNSL